MAGQQIDKRSIERLKSPITVDVNLKKVIVPRNDSVECMHPRTTRALSGRGGDLSSAAVAKGAIRFAFRGSCERQTWLADRISGPNSKVIQSKLEFITRGFFAVADVEAVADQDGMIPGLAFDGGDLCDLHMLLRIGFEQHQIASF